MNGIVIASAKGDARLDAASKVIKNAGAKVIYPDQAPTHPFCDGILLPVPTKRYLNESKAEFSTLISHLRKGGRIFCADKSCFDGSLIEDFRICDYTEDEDFLSINTTATCEGALSLIIASHEKTLRCAKVLILGWGRLAKCLFVMLKSLNAEVFVCARNKKALGEVLALGSECCDFSSLPRLISSSDVIVNTVPARVIDAKALECDLHGKLFLELASAPFGYDPKEITHLGARSLYAPSLPSRFAPLSSGYALGRAVCRLYSADETI